MEIPLQYVEFEKGGKYSHYHFSSAGWGHRAAHFVKAPSRAHSKRKVPENSGLFKFSV
jgi:hypothetical protein